MSEHLTKSIRVGVSLYELQAPSESTSGLAPINVAGIAPDDLVSNDVGHQPTSSVNASRGQTSPNGALPWYRQIARRIFRLVRPLVLPFLHRLDLRTRSSVDQSNSAEVLRGVAATLAGLPTMLEAMRRTDMEHYLHRLDARVQTAANDGKTVTVRLVAEAIEQQLAPLRQQVDYVTRTLAASDNRAHRILHDVEKLARRNIIPLGADVAVRIAAGYLLVPAEDEALLIAVVESEGCLEPGTLTVVSSLMQDGGVFVDVGANIGTFTLPIARRVGPRGRVVAVEPAPRPSALLRRTIALNNVSDRVSLYGCAAGAAETTGRLCLSQQTTHNSFLPLTDTVQTIDVAVRRLDDLIPGEGRVDVVKIDVEGVELDVWRGMQRIVSENPDLAVVLEFGPEHLRRGDIKTTAWFHELTSKGHTPWEIDELMGTLRKLRSSGLDDVYTLNILLLRNPPDHYKLRVA